MMLRPSVYEELPTDYQAGVHDWIESGEWPCRFLTAIIRNDLIHAIGLSDPHHLAELRYIVNWFCTVAPSTCWGSAKGADAWHDKRGAE